MFDKETHYTLRREIIGGFTHYYLSFKDGQNVRRETEVPRLIVAQFMRFKKEGRRQRRWDERHIEPSDLSDADLYRRALRKPKSLEDSSIDGQRDGELRRAILRLPEIQRRRFILYHEFGLTYEQIAGMDGCTFQAVALAVKTAGEKIKKYFEN